jgi:hypothetical protein
MPEISRFFGIIIRMFVEVGASHHTPHFHAYYQDQVGIYTGLEPSRGSPADFPTGKSASFSRGQSCIRVNC